MGSMVVPIRADQLLPQFLLELFDTLPSQYRHTGHVHEEILFWKKIFLTKFQLFELRQFFVQVFNIYSKVCRYGPINSYHSFS